MDHLIQDQLTDFDDCCPHHEIDNDYRDHGGSDRKAPVEAPYERVSPREDAFGVRIRRVRFLNHDLRFESVLENAAIDLPDSPVRFFNRTPAKLTVSSAVSFLNTHNHHALSRR
jgi:hypothetical protein